METLKYETGDKLVVATRRKKTLTLKLDFAKRIVKMNDTGSHGVSIFNPRGKRSSLEGQRANSHSGKRVCMTDLAVSFKSSRELESWNSFTIFKTSWPVRLSTAKGMTSSIPAMDN